MSEEREESGADELRQMQKIRELRLLATAVVLHRLPLIAAVFGLVSAAAFGMIFWITQTAGDRFEAQTNLVFYPKETAVVKPFDNDQVMRIISRRLMAARVASELGMPEAAAAGLFGSFQVWQDQKNRNFYAVKASAPTAAEAIRRVNAYADAARREYATYRLEDLRVRRETTDRRKAEIAAASTMIDDEENALSLEIGVASPLSESERLSREIAEKKVKLAEAQLCVVEAEGRLSDIRRRLGTANPDILLEADAVRRYTEKLRTCDEELDRLRLVYTEQNPKVALAREERKTFAQRYEAFLAKYGMKNLDEGELARIDDLGNKAKTALADLERHASATNAFHHEIGQNSEKLTALLKVLPRFEGFRQRRESLKSGRREVDDTEADLRFLESTVTSELSQLERATGATGASAFSKKKLIAAGTAGALVAGLVALLVLILEFLRGRVWNARELSFYSDAECLGESGVTQEQEDAAFLRFREILGDGRKIYLAPLQGCACGSDFIERLLLQCSLAGIKALFVDIVKAVEYVPDEDDAMFASISYRGDRGKLPVIDPSGFSAMELTMLEADLTMLLSDFDLVFLNGPENTAQNLLAEQLSALCDVRLALVKPRRTLRTALRNFISQEGKRTMTLAVRSVVFAVALLAAGCYFDRLTGHYGQYPDLDDELSAVVDEQGLSEGERAEQLALLKALDEAPPEVYRINAGDRVNFTVYDHPDLSTEATITPDGHLGIVFLGQVKVADLTLGEACAKIEKGLSDYLKKPAVGLTPLTISSQSCTIAGGVNRPGIYPVSSDMRLSDIFSVAGGSATRRIDGDDLSIADMGNSYVFRDGKALPVDFTKAIYGGDRLHNVRLRKNDYIYVGVRSESMVCVIGAVRRPRKQLFDQSLGLVELLTNAGWLEETHWNNVIIIRGGVANPRMYKVDVDAILAGKRRNVMMKSGDVVYVPHDNVSEYNVFIRKILPSGQLFNMIASPFTTWSQFNTMQNSAK